MALHCTHVRPKFTELPDLLCINGLLLHSSFFLFCTNFSHQRQDLDRESAEALRGETRPANFKTVTRDVLGNHYSDGHVNFVCPLKSEAYDMDMQVEF